MLSDAQSSSGELADRVIRIFLDGLEEAGADPRRLDIDKMRTRLLAETTPAELELLQVTEEMRNAV